MSKREESRVIHGFQKEHHINTEILGSKIGRLFEGRGQEIEEEVNSVLDILKMSVRHLRRNSSGQLQQFLCG